LSRRRTRRDGETRREGVKQPEIRRCPNGETRFAFGESLGAENIVFGQHIGI